MAGSLNLNESNDEPNTRYQMLNQTDFLFRAIDPVKVLRTINKPIEVDEVFPEFRDVRLVLPEYCMFADLIVDTTSQDICGFSFQFDTHQITESEVFDLLECINTKHVYMTHHQVSPDLLSFRSDGRDHRVNIIWRVSDCIGISLAQLDEVQWVIAPDKVNGKDRLLGVSCIRTSELTRSLF